MNEKLSTDGWDLNPADFPSDADLEEAATFLLRYAILAPSSHNSQPWRLKTTEDGFDLMVDESRWLNHADPNRRELHLSLGCAVENAIIAAQHHSFSPSLRDFRRGRCCGATPVPTRVPGQARETYPPLASGVISGVKVAQV